MSEYLLKFASNGLIQSEFHVPEDFREQIAVLVLLHESDYYVTVRRIWMYVCRHSLASFDPNNPGVDTSEGWEWIDNAIENEDVVGICHTHPPGCTEFSSQDRAVQRGFAKANGKKLLWHTMQACGSKYLRVICASMPIPPYVFLHDFGEIESNVNETVLQLPKPRMNVNKEIVTIEYSL